MLTNRTYIMLSIVEDEEERGKEGRKEECCDYKQVMRA
jgi:hypothetical protein